VIPLRDENPAHSLPVVSRTIIVLNCVVFAYELMLGPNLRALFYQFGVVPLRLTTALEVGEEPIWIPALTLVTSTFLHGGPLHLIGNMWYLWIFGDNVEDRLGKLRFIVFYLVSGAAAGLAHVLSNPTSQFPTVGASGAIAAVLGAYAVAFPQARIITLIPFIFFFQIAALPALVMLGLWFLYQFLLSFTSAWQPGGGGVAWWAHIGGFVFGAGAMLMLGRRPRSRAEVV
jgi:membrane associated rhomboid family serine protease